ncbi:MAG: sigma 54-interacting transcriptional regulator [Oligoflexia bacterium]|nr:sigma 54-interacting transcriptional regulator [Oligoflexia bacterium]
MQYLSILDSISDGVFTVDLDFNITLFNSAAEKITGFKKETVIGKKCFEIFRTNICKNDCVIKKTLKSGKPITNRKVNVLKKSGQEIPITISTGILKNKNNKIIGAVETFRDCSEIELLRSELDKNYKIGDLIGRSKVMQDIFLLIEDIALSDSTILIEGASGSGKEILAKAIHNSSKRKNHPFVAINCGAIPFNLMETDLFGHLKGAFTDAKTDRPGKFEQAKGGTIFFDEISDLHPLLQVKLLRVLQEREFTPVGGNKIVKTDVRVICATNKNLRDMIEKSLFREDLYFRINVMKIKLPPLTERKEDIPLLLSYFFKKYNAKTGKNITKVSDDVLNLFMSFSFPGNIRELENIIEHAFILCHGEVIDTHHLPKELTDQKIPRINSDSLKSIASDTEKDVLIKLLNKHDFNKKQVAKILKIDPATLWRKMKKYNIKSKKYLSNPS